MIITSRKEALEIFNDELELLGVPKFSESEFQDFDLGSGVTSQQLKGFARDIASEAATDRAANKNSWRYEH